MAFASAITLNLLRTGPTFLGTNHLELAWDTFFSSEWVKPTSGLSYISTTTPFAVLFLLSSHDVSTLTLYSKYLAASKLHPQVIGMGPPSPPAMFLSIHAVGQSGHMICTSGSGK